MKKINEKHLNLHSEFANTYSANIPDDVLGAYLFPALEAYRLTKIKAKPACLSNLEKEQEVE